MNKGLKDKSKEKREELTCIERSRQKEEHKRLERVRVKFLHFNVPMNQVENLIKRQTGSKLGLWVGPEILHL